jgi:hypothetical protein
MNQIVLIVSIVFSFLFSHRICSQEKKDSIPLVLHGVKVGQDTLLFRTLDEVSVIASHRRKGKYYRNTRKYLRTVRNIRVVYPYAQIVNQKIGEINAKLENVSSKKERRKLIRKEYKSMMKDYKAPLMKMKISQGKLLMKLIDRETGSTSYTHLKELKGSMNAFFWQTVALMFGSSLKSEYDPLDKDWMVEEILQRMEKGELSSPRPLY